VPKQFFKIVVWREAGAIRVECFIVTQEGWLVDLPKLERRSLLDEALPDLPKELYVYRLDLRSIENLTDLSFDLPRRRHLEGDAIPEPQLISTINDLE
jgi:hypothetical protein